MNATCKVASFFCVPSPTATVNLQDYKTLATYPTAIVNLQNDRALAKYATATVNLQKCLLVACHLLRDSCCCKLNARKRNATMQKPESQIIAKQRNYERP